MPRPHCAQKVLKMPAKKQDEDMMCTFACGEMIELFYNPNSSRNQISIAQSIWAPEENYNRGIESILMNGHVGYKLEKIESVIYYDMIADKPTTIVNEINNGNPFIAGLRITDPLSHAVVVSGYLNIGGINYVIYNEPMTKKRNLITYTSFANGGIPAGETKAAWWYTYITKKNEE